MLDVFRCGCGGRSVQLKTGVMEAVCLAERTGPVHIEPRVAPVEDGRCDCAAQLRMEACACRGAGLDVPKTERLWPSRKVDHQCDVLRGGETRVGQLERRRIRGRHIICPLPVPADRAKLTLSSIDAARWSARHAAASEPTATSNATSAIQSESVMVASVPSDRKWRRS